MKKRAVNIYAIIFILTLTVGLMFADKTFSNAKSSVKRVIYVGQSCKFPFTANVRLYYSSSNPNVAKVSDDGKITGIRKGNAIITGRYGTSVVQCRLSVKPVKKNKFAKQILKLVNKERKKRGLGKVKLDTTLSSVANTRAVEISRKFSHKRPHGGYYYDIINSIHYNCKLSGENIAGGQVNAKAVMKAWMKSPGHKANILRKGFNRLGVGFYTTNFKYAYYWVQVFAQV